MKNRYKTLVFFVVCDMLAAVISIVASLLLTGQPAFALVNKIEYIYVCYPIALVLSFYLFKIYNILWRYTGKMEL